MRLKEVGEFGFIERIRRHAPTGKGVLRGIGDDAAWIACKRKTLLVTTDLLLEGFHFNLQWISFHGLGHKALSVNLSDIAAMGGVPVHYVLSLGVPVDFRLKDIQEFYGALKRLSVRTGVSLIGGDTSASDRLLINITLFGYAPYGPVFRAGASPGEDLYVTGTLGDSALGLDLLKKRKPLVRKNDASYLISRHHFPTARLKAGTLLAKKRLATAMIDVSDGLLQDLGHLCKASRIGAVVWSDALPLSRPLDRVAGDQAGKYALTGGEDYELLFSSRRRDRSRLEKIKKQLGVPISRIGQCLPARDGIKVLNKTGQALSFPASGHDHFKN
jgi:thiamine-monophosphate kinase